MSEDILESNAGGAAFPETVTVAGRRLPVVRTLAVIGVGLLLAAPFLASSFYTRLLTEALILSIFAIGVDLLWGYTGIMTFGHAIFFGIGAYGMGMILEAELAGGAIATTVVGLLVATVATGVLGLVIAGVLFYRGIQGGYFTIITLALAIVAAQIATSWTSVTGGFNGFSIAAVAEIGIPGVVSIRLLGLPLYFAAAVALVGAFLFAWRVVRSPFGKALVAISENETKARALGYDVEQYKTLIFAIGSAMAGLSGALFASYQGFVSPPLLGFLLSTEVLIWILVGGRGTLIGAVVGTVFLVIFESVLSGIFQFSWTLLLGVVLVVIVLRYPAGFIGIAEGAWQRIAARTREGAHE
jgi:ABC-type branched-subunit amino acid transport system permease subunit